MPASVDERGISQRYRRAFRPNPTNKKLENWWPTYSIGHGRDVSRPAF